LQEPLEQQVRFGGGTANPAAAIRSQSSPKKRPYKNHENHSGSAGSTPPVNFAPAITIFRWPAASEILTVLKNHCLIVDSDLAFCLLHTARYE